jgi:hypothetical protein
MRVQQPDKESLIAGAKLSFELFEAYVKAGFTEAQAIQLLIAMVTAGMQTTTDPLSQIKFG